MAEVRDKSLESYTVAVWFPDGIATLFGPFDREEAFECALDLKLKRTEWAKETMEMAPWSDEMIEDAVRRFAEESDPGMCLQREDGSPMSEEEIRDYIQIEFGKPKDMYSADDVCIMKRSSEPPYKSVCACGDFPELGLSGD